MPAMDSDTLFDWKEHVNIIFSECLTLISSLFYHLGLGFTTDSASKQSEQLLLLEYDIVYS